MNKNRKGRIFQVEFEIEARERETAEYLDEVRNSMLTWFGTSYEIERVGK